MQNSVTSVTCHGSGRLVVWLFGGLVVWWFSFLVNTV